MFYRDHSDTVMEEMGEAGMGKGDTHQKIIAILHGRVDKGLGQAGSDADWEDRLERHFERRINRIQGVTGCRK